MVTVPTSFPSDVYSLPRGIYNVVVETLSELTSELNPRWEGERLARNVRKQLTTMSVYDAIAIYAEAQARKAH